MEAQILAQPIELVFDNNLSEHLAAERLYYRSTMFWKGDKIAAVCLVVGGVLLTIASGGLTWGTILVPLGVVEWFNLLSPRPLQIWYWFKNNPKVAETYRLGFDDAGIHFRTDTMDSRISWDHYSSLLEDDRLCLLVYGKRMYSVVPKRAFRSPAELESFRRLVREKVSHGNDDGGNQMAKK